MAQYNSGKKTEDAFAQLAKDNSVDNNANDGGLYENVYPRSDGEFLWQLVL